MHLQQDSRLKAVGTVRIDWEAFKKALKRNYFSDEYYGQRQDRSFVLRLYPPFETTMNAQYYESMQGRHYNDEWDNKPFHMQPELFLVEASDAWQTHHVEWPTERSVRNHCTPKEIEAEGGIEESLSIARDIFWDEVRYALPDQIDLGIFTHGPSGDVVDIEWTNLDN